VKLPSNLTEAQVLAAIEKVVNILAPSFRFGYFDIHDIKQEARIFGMQGMEKYDEARPLENFLYSHIKNRLINFKRDKFRRNDPPCPSCHNAIAGATSHEDGQYCDKYITWRDRNLAKQNIMNPLDLSNICDEKESRTRMPSSVVEDVERSELLKRIDDELPVELRATYLQMRDGASVPKPKRLEVERAILNILQGDLVCQTNEDQ
jgi:DNA-directed RNA polymerase specialized sigma24 family protein